MRRLRLGRRIGTTGVLLAMNLIAATLLGIQSATQPAFDAESSSRTGTLDAVKQVPLPTAAPLAPKADFGVVLDKYLFHVSRQAPVPVPPPPPPASPPPPPSSAGLQTYALMGVVRYGDRRIALLRQGSGPDQVQLAEGDRLLGWAVQAITDRSVEFRIGSASYRIEFPREEPASVAGGGGMPPRGAQMPPFPTPGAFGPVAPMPLQTRYNANHVEVQPIPMSTATPWRRNSMENGSDRGRGTHDDQRMCAR